MVFNIQDTTKKPSVTLEEKLVDSMIVLFVKDTASNVTDISRIMKSGYGELFSFVHQNDLKIAKVMAFYYSYEPPFICDIAVEVNEAPASTKGRIKINKLPGGNAVIAHFRGPYEKLELAYTEIKNWLVRHNRKAKGRAFEVYLDDPAMVKDANELRTDVYQQIQ